MAGAGFILHGARGKVGNLVARKGEKGTVLSEYKVPANPQTAGQMRTRIAFGTVAKAGAALTDLVGISMQGETTIKGARRRFNSLNISKLTRLVKSNYAEGVYAPKGMSLLIPNKYIVSDGTIRNATLGTVQVAGDGATAEFQVTSQTALFPVGTSFSASQLLKMLFGVETGDQITLVGISSGVPVEYNPDNLQILRDGQMKSARVFFKSADEINLIEDSPVLAPDTDVNEFKDWVLSAIARSISEGYQGFVKLLEDEAFYEVTFDTEEQAFSIMLDPESVLGKPDLSLVLGNNSSIKAFGYFRSHLNTAGTQWMFSRCELTVIAPVYTETTYSTEDYVNYGYSYLLALDSYLKKSVLETTRYTETGGPDNTLGF